MFNKKNLIAYYFIDQINERTISTIFKFKNISLIYLNQNDSFLNLQDLINIKKFCNKNRIKFYISDNIRLAIKVGANGIYLTKNYNKMLHKKSGLTYEVVRERYEHFRARCATTSTSKAKTCAIATGNAPSTSTTTSTGKKGTPESGCVVPMYGEKARCIIKIVPQKQKGETFQVDKKCVKKHLGTMFSMKKENPRKRRLHTIRRRRRV